jgi:hypothetical protein
MGKLTIECDTGRVSDGYHTFDELYEHRCVLFIAFANYNPGIGWKSKVHDDGKGCDGWFIAGLNLPNGTISYHLPMRMWRLLDVPELDRAPKWDGHTPLRTW